VILVLAYAKRVSHSALDKIRVFPSRIVFGAEPQDVCLPRFKLGAQCFVLGVKALYFVVNEFALPRQAVREQFA
jgi:hypothetical protein